MSDLGEKFAGVPTGELFEVPAADPVQLEALPAVKEPRRRRTIPCPHCRGMAAVVPWADHLKLRAHEIVYGSGARVPCRKSDALLCDLFPESQLDETAQRHIERRCTCSDHADRR